MAASQTVAFGFILAILAGLLAAMLRTGRFKASCRACGPWRGAASAGGSRSQSRHLG